ncbi:MAG TPA: FtsQ-type POTRA domain-containing protein [Acidimicrobiales bacterium]|jgi:cell division septal protein FtsQ|nr:FtsQ-type POTRA domain-containing protein [Acidimicrobiales bacterium]
MSPATTRTRPPARPAPRKRAPVDPRISARRTAVTRQQGQRRLRVLIALAALIVLVVGGWFLVHSALFSARAITVVGATHETAAQVEAAAGVADHPALAGINAGAAARAVETLPWVSAATVHVQWPDGVRIVVTEAVAKLAMATADGQWATLSAAGRVLALSATQPAGLVVVTGPGAPGAPGTTLSHQDQSGLLVATTLPASFAAQVTGVHVEPGGWVQLSMTTPIAVDIGTATQLTAKYEDVTSILAHATLHNGDVIDVSVPGASTVTGG